MNLVLDNPGHGPVIFSDLSIVPTTLMVYNKNK